MQQLAQIVLSGLLTGAIYGFVALGISLVFRLTHTLNLVQGEFAVASVLLTWTAMSWGWPSYASATFAVIVVAAMALPIERLTIYLPRNREVLDKLLISLAIALLLQGVMLLFWGRTSYTLPTLSAPAMQLLGARLGSQAWWLFFGIGALGIGIPLWLKRTRIGLFVRASADNPLGSKLFSIPVRRIVVLTFVAAAVVGALGGILSAPVMLIRYDTGLLLTVKGFIAAVFGGMNRTWGAIAGGIALGILESAGASVLPGQFKDAGVFLALLALIVFLPRLWPDATVFHRN